VNWRVQDTVFAESSRRGGTDVIQAIVRKGQTKRKGETCGRGGWGRRKIRKEEVRKNAS